MTLRVFIVDDDEDFAASLAMVLEGVDCETEIAHNGEDALKIFREREFDIAFMDVKLPGKNGVECYLEVKAMRPGARVVMMTGYSTEGLLEKAIREGAWATMQKPLDMARVVGMVESLKSAVILIADDDPDFTESLRTVLERRGMRTLASANGREAVEQVRAGGIDVLLLDLRMPVLDGLETVLELKHDGESIPTIIVTGYSEEDEAILDRLRNLSVNHIFSKPFPPLDLVKVVEDMLKTRPA